MAQLRLAERQTEGNTIQSAYAEHLRQYACAFRGLQRYADADAMQLRYSVVQDSLSSRKIAGQAQKLATQFRMHEKERELQEAKALAERRVMLLVFSLIILLLLMVLTVVISLNLHKTRQRNRIIVKQIDELLAQRKELRRNSATDASRPGTAEEYAAFLRMEQTVVERKLFLQPNFGRDDLLTLTPFDKNELVIVLQKYTDSRNVTEYLGRLRVEYAVRSLKEHPDFSIDAVLEASGFKSRATFYRAFYKVFGMTPAQYLNSLER